MDTFGTTESSTEEFSIMFFFGIPLKSRKLSKDWDRTTQLVNHTINSMLRQTDPTFKILLACHEQPELNGDVDCRLEVLPVDFPPPVFRDEPNVDKHRKREVIAARVRQLGGGVIMFVDADDLVSNRLVQYVNRNPHPYGYYVQDGFELNTQTNKVRYCPWFYKTCGSCAILTLEPDDLPKVPMEESVSRLRKLLLNTHPTMPGVMAAEGTPLQPLPFRAVMYVTRTGENLSDQIDPAGWRRRLLRMAHPERRPSNAVANEFGLL